MKKIYFALLISLFLNSKADAQILVASTGFDNYAGTVATIPAGWYCSWNTSSSFYTSTGNYGIAAPSYKFGNDSDFVVAPKVVQGITKVTFFARGNGVPFSSANELQFFQSTDSINWVLVTSVDSLPVTGTTITVNLNGNPYLKFLYHKQAAGGNLAFDDVMIYSNTTSMSEVAKSETIKIYPTPSTGIVYVKLPESVSDVKVEVFDILGNAINNLAIQKENPSLFTINFTGKSKGFYFVKIAYGSKMITRKITITE